MVGPVPPAGSLGGSPWCDWVCCTEGSGLAAAGERLSTPSWITGNCPGLRLCRLPRVAAGPGGLALLALLLGDLRFVACPCTDDFVS